MKNKNKKKYYSPQFLKKKKFSIFIFLFILFLIFIHIPYNSGNSDDNNQNNSKISKPDTSGFIWARLDLTNPSEVNDSVKPFTHNTEIKIKGKLYNEYNGETKNGSIVIIVVDGKQYPKFNDTTKDGEFQINYTIDASLNVFLKHKIEALVISGIPLNGEVEYYHHYIIDVNASSYFDTQKFDLNIPQYAEGTYSDPGFLRYDNNSGIPYQLIDISWYNKSLYNINTSTTYTNSDGSFKSLSIPGNNSYKILYLNLTYNGNSTYINGKNKFVSISLYRNITCVWNTVTSATEGNQITVRGQIFARNNSNLRINSTEVRLRMSGASIGSTFTNEDGIFALTYTIPSGTSGSNIIEVELLNYPIINSNNTHLINIVAAPVTPSDDIKSGGDKTPPPFQNFFMVLIPIIIGIVAGFAVFAYFYLRKQEEESKLIKLPLEDRIRNFKILKETGRMEESLSYLFQSIYMELINGKYGRRIEENETIRDFAIISVKDLNLNPATIYPFIQKVEEIIYARPFIINDKDFYETVELFSPIYFELTGYNFVLNF